MKTRTIILFILFVTFGGCSKKEDVIKIGWIGPLTGEAAYYASMVQNATIMAEDEINSQGGINGKKIQLIFEDDQLNPALGISAFNKLITLEKVPLVIQAAGSGVMLAEAPIAERAHVVLISPTCSNDKIRDAGDYIFRTWPSDAYQGKFLADFAITNLKTKTASILYLKNEYGEGLKNEFEKEYSKNGATIILEESFLPGGTDFRSILTKVKQKQSDIIVLASLYKESALLIKQARELGIKTQIVGGDGNFAPELITLSGKSSEGVIISNMKWSVKSEEPVVKTFVTKFKETFGKEPEVYAAAGYDCMKIVAEAIRVGGYSSEEIKKALYNIKGYNGVTGTISFDEFGEIEGKYDAFIVKNGNFEPYK